MSEPTKDGVAAIPRDEAEGMLRVEPFVCDEGHEWAQLAEWTDGAWVPLGGGCLKCQQADRG